MPPNSPPQLIIFWWTVMGLFVGSFLNVAIHRLPLEGESINRPRRSRCPKCRESLSWRENIPLFSWLIQRGRCKHCSVRISARYPLVELLTAFLWFLAAREAPDQPGLVLVWVVVISGLVVATFVDFDHFEIPDEVSIGGCWLAPLAALAVPELHAHTYAAELFARGEAVGSVASLVGCLAGMAVGWGILWGIGWIGGKVYGIDAMGFGDVKLMAAGGGFIGPEGVLYALMIAAFAGSIMGVANILRWLVVTRRRAAARGRRDPWSRSLRIARFVGRYIPFGPYLALGIGILLLYRNHVTLVGF